MSPGLLQAMAIVLPKTVVPARYLIYALNLGRADHFNFTTTRVAKLSL